MKVHLATSIIYNNTFIPMMLCRLFGSTSSANFHRDVESQELLQGHRGGRRGRRCLKWRIPLIEGSARNDFCRSLWGNQNVGYVYIYIYMYVLIEFYIHTRWYGWWYYYWCLIYLATTVSIMNIIIMVLLILNHCCYCTSTYVYIYRIIIYHKYCNLKYNICNIYIDMSAYIHIHIQTYLYYKSHNDNCCSQ